MFDIISGSVSVASGKVETINGRLRQRDIKARRRRVQEDGMSLPPIQEDAFDTMPKSDSVQESDGVALLIGCHPR